MSVVSDTALESVERFAAWATNVHGTLTMPDFEDSEQVSEVWSKVRHRPPVYSLAPFDPLAAVVDAWAVRLLGEGDEVELAIDRSPAVDPPDFYIVDEHLETTRRSWYLEGLFARAPARVAAFDGTPDDLSRRLRSLGFGPALPTTAQIVSLARDFVPGTSGLAPVLGGGPAGPSG